MTHMKYRFLGGNIPENYRRRTKIQFYYYNGTQVKDAYIRGLNFDLGETKRMNYFIRGKNNFIVPAYTDSCTIIFNVKDKFGNDTPKKILKYSGRYDNATRHSPLHKKYWTKQSDTEYYYTITREDFEAAEDL